eukprot:symbB.v1.2.002276.t1/scaffold122.1/size316190/9
MATMADTPLELKVNTLEGGVITVQVTQTNTVQELKTMLCEKKHEDPVERKILKAEVLLDGALVHCDSQTLQAVGLLDGEFEVTVVYSRNEVEAATKAEIHGEGFVQVNLPASLVEISSKAFENCRQVVKVAIPESVTSIADHAFAGCSSLESVSIPESVAVIGPCAFAECRSLASITIPGSVRDIGPAAFARCSSLVSVTIPESVTAIETCAFEGCKSLVRITIPESLMAIGDNAFAECSSLGSVTIPGSVTAIGKYAFAGCNMKNIIIPQSVAAIEAWAFEGCESLASVTIPESVTAIGDHAFAGCKSLASVTIPESVTAIEQGAFAKCYSLQSVIIPQSVAAIAAYAFAECRSLENAKEPRRPEGPLGHWLQPRRGRRVRKVARLGTTAVTEQQGIASLVTVWDLQSVGIAQWKLLSDEERLRAEALAGSVDAQRRFVAMRAALRCILAERLGVRPVELRFRYGQYGKPELDAPWAQRRVSFSVSHSGEVGAILLLEMSDQRHGAAPAIGVDLEQRRPRPFLRLAKRYFTTAEVQTLQKLKEEEQARCFFDMWTKKEAWLKTLGTGLAGGLTSLDAAESGDVEMTIMEAAQETDEKLTYAVSTLTDTPLENHSVSVCLPKGTALRFDHLSQVGWPHLLRIVGQKMIKFVAIIWRISQVLLAAMADTVRKLNLNTLEGGVLAVQVTQTNTVYELKTMLREKKHEDPIERKIIKAEVLLDGALVHCDYQTLEAVGLLDGEFEVTVVYSRNEVEAATKTEIYATGFVQVNIPASLVKISARAFEGCDQLVRVVIPESVTAIGESAFERCSSLRSITIPKSVTAIGDRAFELCWSLVSITIPESVTAIGDSAFKRCICLRSITIPESVTTIGPDAFKECSSLGSITIPESVTAIGDGAFAKCSSLASITIPESVTVIGNCAFANCSSLESIAIPESVPAIGYSAFTGCSSLRTLTIPESVVAIEACAFAGCSSLVSIAIRDSVTVIGPRAFTGCSSLGSIAIPDSVTAIDHRPLEKALLQSASLWKVSDKNIPLSSEDVERQELLQNDVMISEGLTKFAKDFVKSVSTHLELVDHLLAVLRAMEPSFDFEASVQAQVWALASGVKATAPRVAVEMKKHLSRLQELRTSTHKVYDLFERKRNAMQEKTHYTVKVETLRREFQEREEQRKGNSKEQLHRLSRNQEKLAYAESAYNDAANLVTKKIEEQLRCNRSLLFSSLEGLAQCACCGWLVSTGAVACKALQLAQEAQEPAAKGAAEVSRQDVPRGMLVLPPVVAEETLEPLEPFDPSCAFMEATPLSKDIFDLDEEMDLHGSDPSKSSSLPKVETLARRSVKDLKELIRQHGLNDDGLVEKSELV